MILAKLGHHFRQQDWFTVVVELLVVIVGLMLAFQLDRWRDELVDEKADD